MSFKTKQEAFAAMQAALATIQKIKAPLPKPYQDLVDKCIKVVAANTKTADATAKKSAPISADITNTEDKAQENDDTCFVYEKLTWKLNIEGIVPDYIKYKVSSEITEKVLIKLGDEEPKIWKKSLPHNSLTYKSDGSNTGYIEAEIGGKDKKGVYYSYSEKFEIPNADKCYDLTVEARWFGDGEKEFPILVNGLAFGSGGTPDYWDIRILEKIQDETGADLSAPSTGSSKFINGNRSTNVVERYEDGVAQAKKEAFSIFSKLKRNPATGQIIQKIQMYTHSKGSAFGDGYLDELKRQAQIYHKQYDNIFYDIDHLIDITVDMDAHQSWGIRKEEDNHPNIAIAHGNGIADSNQRGDIIGFDRTTPVGYEGQLDSHGNGSFTEELDMILDQHNKNEFSKNPDKYEGFEDLFDENDKQTGRLTEINKPTNKKK